MATLNTLRTKGGWIVTIVIGLALLAFLIGDLAGRNSIFGGNEKVGKIDGTNISYLEYWQKVESLTEMNKLLSGTDAISGEQQDMIREQAWAMLIQETTIFPGLEEMGIMVTEEELLERIYGTNISPVLLGLGWFNDQQTGNYDKAAVQRFVSNLDADRTGNSRKIWQYLQDQVRQEALMSKYMTLMNNMAYVTDTEASVGAQRTNMNYNARFVSQGYDTIADSLVKVSSQDVRKYYDERKELYKRAASRNLEYVVFEVLPSAKDYADAKAFVETLASEFAEAESVQQYASLNSYDQIDSRYFSLENLPSGLAAYVSDSDRPVVYGPELSNNVYSMTRISDMRSFPDTIAFRQMAFMPGTEALADSVLNELKKGANFDVLAAEHSLIPAESADAGRVSTMAIPMEMGDPIYSTRDKYVKIETVNGIIILDVYYRGPESRKVQLATITYHVEPSSATQQIAYAKASGFYTATAGLRSNFDKIAADSVYTKRVANVSAGQSQISGMENGRELVRWSFNNKPGDISGILEIDDNYVVAVLTGATEDGYAPVESVQEEIAAVLRMDKKAEMLTDKMKGASSLDALAQTLSTQVGEVTDANFNSFYLPEIGFEPAMIGAVCGGVAEGQISKPVKGMSGVYVVEITSQTNTDATSSEMEQVRLEAQAQNNLMQRTYGALVQKSNVVDGRSKYF